MLRSSITLASKVTKSSARMFSSKASSQPFCKAHPELRNLSMNIMQATDLTRLVKPEDLRIKAAILDGSGTTMDRFVILPAVAFVETFKEFGVPISMQEARIPMALRKDLHIQALTKMDGIRERWFKAYGSYPGQAEVDKLFAWFTPFQDKLVPKYSDAIKGVPETVHHLQKVMKVLCGFSTGFGTSTVKRIEADLQRKHSIKFDCMVPGDGVKHGARPFPFMVFKNADELAVPVMSNMVKVDDTVAGVGEGLNAGNWTVGVTDSSNYMDIDSMEQWEKMSASEKEARHQKSIEILKKSGAHYVVDNLNQLPAVIEDINYRMIVKNELPLGFNSIALKNASELALEQQNQLQPRPF